MKKLFSCLYGSRLYGTATPESDRDVKHVFLPDINSLIMGIKPKNVRNKTDVEDTEFIPLHVFAGHFIEGQTYALELAYAVNFCDAEQSILDPRFDIFCFELRSRFLTSDIQAMVSHASVQAKKYSFKGDRLNAAVEAHKLFKAFPPGSHIGDCPIDFEMCAQALERDFPECIQMGTYDDGKGVMQPCFRLLGKIIPYTRTFGNGLNTIEALITRYGDRANRAAVAQADWKAMAHAVRILDQGISLLSYQGLIFPYEAEYVEHLRTILRGEKSAESVSELIDSKLTTLKFAASESMLPRNSPRLKAELDQWLLDWLHEFYKDEHRNWSRKFYGTHPVGPFYESVDTGKTIA